MNDAIVLFDEAKFFEGSIELCSQLSDHYVKNVYNYQVREFQD